MILFVDIDGTLFDHSHRIHYVTTDKPKNWAAYYGLMHLDPPIEAAVGPLLRFVQRGFTILLLTGRPEEYRPITHQQLDAHFPFIMHRPFMRPTGDRSKSYLFKESIVGPIAAKREGIVFIDDDLRNVEMFSKYGVFLKAPECWEVLK